MSRKPYKNIRTDQGQKGIYKCKQCGKVWLDDPKGVNDKDFCSEECEKHYNAQSKPDLDKSPIEGKKEQLL